MTKKCPAGRKSVYTKVLTTSAFAIAVLCFSSMIGAAQTKNNIPCNQPTISESNETAEPPIDPATMGYIFGGGYRGYIDGFASLNGISSFTIVGKAFDSLMTQIVGKSEPTVAANHPDQSQSNVGNPCIARKQ
jgi:hypothetical protein